MCGGEKKREKRKIKEEDTCVEEKKRGKKEEGKMDEKKERNKGKIK